jgi:hypothetical protein
MIPTETSTNLRSAMVRAEAERGIRTMIARAMLAQRYAVFSKRNAIDSNPMRIIASANGSASPLRHHCCDYVRTRNLRSGWLLISYVYIPPGPRGDAPI